MNEWSEFAILKKKSESAAERMDDSFGGKQIGGAKKSALIMEKSKSYHKQGDLRPSSLLSDKNEESKGKRKQVKFGEKTKHQTEVADRRGIRQEAAGSNGKNDKS